MPETPAFLVERLKTEGEKTAAFFSALADGQWTLPVYSEGETWTVRSLLAHYVSAERELFRLFIDIQNGGPGAPNDFSVDGYNASQQKIMAELSAQELLEQFGAGRAQTVTFVSGLSAADLEKQGRHPFMGRMTLGDMIKVVYRHNRLHERELREILGAM
jgi:DinB superfamily